MIDDLLRQAISAIKSGDKVLGKQLLVQVLEQDSRNEFAWLWLSKCVSSHEQKLDCIKRVLKINPNNATAQKELSRLQSLSQINLQSAPRATALPKKKPVSKLIIFIVSSVFLAIFCICLYVFGLALMTGSNTPNDTSRTPSASATEAYTSPYSVNSEQYLYAFCAVNALDRLGNPEDNTYIEPFEDAWIHAVGDGTYSVTSWVRVRTTTYVYTCVAELINGDWRVLELDFITQ